MNNLTDIDRTLKIAAKRFLTIEFIIVKVIHDRRNLTDNSVWHLMIGETSSRCKQTAR